MVFWIIWNFFLQRNFFLQINFFLSKLEWWLKFVYNEMSKVLKEKWNCCPETHCHSSVLKFIKKVPNEIRIWRKIFYGQVINKAHTQKYDLSQLSFESVFQESDNVFCDNQAGGISLLIRQILLLKTTIYSRNTKHNPAYLFFGSLTVRICLIHIFMVGPTFILKEHCLHRFISYHFPQYFSWSSQLNLD